MAGDSRGRSDEVTWIDQSIPPDQPPRAVTDGYRDDPEDLLDLVEPDDTPSRMELDEEVTEGVTARDCVERFEPTRAWRPDLSAGAASEYLESRRAAQPKLERAAEQDPCVQRVYAALDQGRFHGTARHEGTMTDDEHLSRLLRREDPAQTDPDKRERAIDAYRKGNQRHLCPEYSTSVDDPVAYAVALVRGVEHPAVRTALESPPDPPRRPRYVQLPIADLLGDDGHRFCDGYQLVGDDLRQAAKDRDTYLKARWRGQETEEVAEPRATRVESFQDGVMEFRFVVNDRHDRYELTTMFPKPKADPPEITDPDDRPERT